MAKRGRKGKAAALKVLAGERADRLPMVTPCPSRVDIAPPSYLDDDGISAWQRITGQLGDLGRLDATDAEALGIYCTTYSRWIAACNDIKNHGVTSTTDLGSTKGNPACAVAAQAERLMSSMLVEFGLTPASRARVKSSGEAPKDALADFLAKKKA